MKVTPINTLSIDDVFTILVHQTSKNDLIFNDDNKVRYANTTSLIGNDPYYLRPDKEQYIFTTVNDQLHALHSNNMITPIRKKYGLNDHYAASCIREALKLNNKASVRGVFIVDYFYIYNDYNCSTDAILKHYGSINTLGYDYNTSREIISIVLKRQTDNTNRMVIRVVTFVPEEILNEYGYVYVPTADITLIRYGLSNTLASPTSKEYKDNIGLDVEDIKNVFVFDVVDNKKAAPYFVKIGNRTHRIYPTKNIERDDGVTLSIKKNSSNLITETADLTDMATKLGVYTSKDAADTSGNLQLIMDEKKHQLELKKISNEHYKLNHEKEKLILERDFYKEKYLAESRIQEQKIKLAELDVVKKVVDIEFDVDKKIIECEQAFQKFDIEQKLSQQKYSYDITKISIDLLLKLASAAQVVIKMF